MTGTRYQHASALIRKRALPVATGHCGRGTPSRASVKLAKAPLGANFNFYVPVGVSLGVIAMTSDSGVAAGSAPSYPPLLCS